MRNNWEELRDLAAREEISITDTTVNMKVRIFPT